MKKRLIILLLISIFCLILASCNLATRNCCEEPKSLYELAVEAGFEGSLEEWCEAIANEEPKSLYELAVEAGFEGTLEEWGEAVANSTLPKDTTINCLCPSCQNLISSADAIIIAQTHFFAVYANAENIYYDNLVTVALLSNEDSENWYILISPEDVVGDIDLIYKGGSHLYTISKKTGNIVNIKFGGE